MNLMGWHGLGGWQLGGGVLEGSRSFADCATMFVFSMHFSIHRRIYTG